MQRRVAGSFLITESMFPGGSTLPAHAHETAYFTLTLKGSYREQFGSHWRVCAPGSLVAHPAHELHSQIFDRQSALLVRLAFADDASERAVREFVPERPLALTSASVARAAWQLHQEMSLADGFCNRTLRRWPMNSSAMQREVPGSYREVELEPGGPRPSCGRQFGSPGRPVQLQENSGFRARPFFEISNRNSRARRANICEKGE